MSNIKRTAKLKSNLVIPLFFDFYLLTSLDFYIGKNGLIINHYKKREKISDEYEKCVEKLYPAVRDSLEWSVRGEIRHFEDCCCVNHDSVFREFYKFSRYKLSKLKLETIKDLFEYGVWESDYGGETWAVATGFLLENPRTIQEKTYWMDRVFDHQHNNGFILNKTEFEELEYSYGSDEVYSNYLDFRRNAKMIKLSKFSSKSIRKLLLANKNLLPQSVL